MKEPTFLSYEEFKNIYSRVPRLCVEIIAICDGKVLLTKRSIPPCEGLWHTPGGTVAKGEKLEETVRRVAKKEIGVNVRVVKNLGVIEYFPRDFRQDVGLAFLVEPESRAFRLNGEASAWDLFETLPEDMILEQRDFLAARLSLPVASSRNSHLCG